MSVLPEYKTAFLQSCLCANVLTFGSYTLNSGRQSPYFFNAGSFHTGNLLSAISAAYARTIVSFLEANPSIPKPQVLFGPSYKGIPLACSTLLKLVELDPTTWSNVSYSFNRKEPKDHGEGGSIVGGSLKDKNILVLDDVVTAGTAMRQTIELVAQGGGKIIGFVVALDRMEKMPGPKDKDGKEEEGGERMSAIGQLRKEYGIITASIATLDDLIKLLGGMGNAEDMQRLEDYRKRYRASE